MRTTIILLVGLTLFSGFSPLTPAGSANRSGVPAYSGVSFSFVNFMAHRQQNGVALSWIVSDPAAVSSYVIRRSYDGVTFYAIDEVPPSAAQWNRYRDTSVFPGYVWYEIIAVLTDGSEVCSAIEQVRIVSKK
jgi:hypothetical protein